MKRAPVAPRSKRNTRRWKPNTARRTPLPDEVERRLHEIELALAAFDDRPLRHDPADVARAGIFVGIGADGSLRVERGFVRPEDEPSVETDTPASSADPAAVQRAVVKIGGAPVGSDAEATEEDGTIRPLSDRLVLELTAHRTLALRDVLANAPDAAFQAVLHALCLGAFYRHGAASCLEITARQTGFSAQAPGLAETASAKAIEARHAHWAGVLPAEAADLWEALTGMDRDGRAALFAHCASLTVNVVKGGWNQSPGALAHGDQLAGSVGLDMAAAGWVPSVDNYLGRVPKARILEAVREARDERSAQLIAHLKKSDMAREAERMLAGSFWLPEPLRLAVDDAAMAEPDAEADTLPDFLTGEPESEPLMAAE